MQILYPRSVILGYIYDRVCWPLGKESLTYLLSDSNYILDYYNFKEHRNACRYKIEIYF